MASTYITEQQMLHYRTLTTLLAQTEVIEETRDDQRSKYLDLTKVPEPTNKALYSAFSYFTALLVRGDEVVAVLPTRESAKAVDVTVVHEPHEWAVARNPRFDEVKGNQTNLTSLPKIKADFIDTPHHLLDVEENYGSAFFRYGRDVPFDVHCQLVLKLLKLNLKSSTDNTRRRTAGKLVTWTMLASNTKMVKRLKSGINNRNVWYHLAELTDEDISQKAPTADDFKPDHLSTRAPSQEQARFLRTVKSHVGQNWTEGMPLFDKSGRRMIRALLRQLLIPVKDSLEELKKFLAHKDTLSAMRLDEQSPEFSDKLKESRSLVNKAFKSLRTLSQFIELFKQHILFTCKWIAKIFNLRRTTVNIETSQTGKKSPASSPFVPSSTQAPSSAPSAEAELESDASERPEEGHYQIPSEETAEDDIEASAELNDLHVTSKKGWGEVVMRWLEVLCLHVQALESLTVLKAPDINQQRMSQYVAKVTLKVVDVQPEVKDQRMQSFDDFIDNFEMGFADRDSVKGWLIDLPTMGQRAWKRARFTGTWHCETILLSLHALANLDPSLASDTSASAISQSVKPSAAVPSDVIEYFKHRGSMLMISKRCCSSCNTLAAGLPDTWSPVVYPGSHVQWSAVALPPWLLEKTAKKLTTVATNVLFLRFEKIAHLLKIGASVRKRSLSAASHVPPEEPRQKRPRHELPDIDEEAIVGEESSEMQGLQPEAEGGGDEGGSSEMEL